ncbi:efflux RND transporter periplasmic adaptor subunit [Cohaesibacter sp. CAU 1516]|uniref:efflux RND transporter periplasmic adaptor subunit n=1 Tax=Cohaesibacter sp. CAU 1516 TaxID=2576038 RepID=UPI0010FDB9CF|nr:efflux RND transporter periplasmic adaptor subunit [Cohaesibacter sp. CAU 1516]TLP46025.1 efflux RND transporter periplasmic adaptor subunit [Cohaesibacter sp. CAU 1516]
MNYHTDETNKTAPSRGKAALGADVTDLPDQSQTESSASRTDRQSGAMRVVNVFSKLFLPLLVIAGAGFLSWQLVVTKPEVHKRAPREKAYAVQARPALVRDYRPKIRLYGTVSASRKVELRTLVNGEVIWVNPALAEGQLVKEGDALVRIDPFDYEGGVTEAEANLMEAKAKLAETKATLASDEAALAFLIEQRDFAANDLQRAQTLVESGSLTKQALENRKLTLSQREQSVNARVNNLAVLRARVEQQNANIERLDWRLKQARRNLADTSLKAPFTGLVQSKNVDLGRSVSGNDTLVSLYDPDQMDVRFTLSDAQYGRLLSDGIALKGRDIKVLWKLGDRVQSHDAVIERITPEVNAANGGIEVYARLTKGSALRSGTFVELQVPDKLYQNAITVPQAAIYQGNLIYVVEDGRMQPREVSILAYLGDDVLIDGSGFTSEDQIVSTRVAEAGPGLKVLLPGSEEVRPGSATKADKRGRPAAEGTDKQTKQGAKE